MDGWMMDDTFSDVPVTSFVITADKQPTTERVTSFFFLMSTHVKSVES